MISVKTNISLVNSSLLRKLDVIRNPGQLLRPVAFDVLVLITQRIHEEGKAADGNDIGTYNNRYLRLRQRKFKRSADNKVIVSLTRQLENDWSVIATDKGWGIGFKNPLNAKKLRWVEQQKGKKIGALKQTERTYAVNRLKELVQQQLNN